MTTSTDIILDLEKVTARLSLGVAKTLRRHLAEIINLEINGERLAVDGLTYTTVATVDPLPWRTDGAMRALLRVGRSTTEVTVIPATYDRHIATFAHLSATSLVTLRQVLEPVRVGQAMRRQKTAEAGAFSNQQQSLVGPGPTNLTYSVTPDGVLSYFRLGFANHDRYLELKFQNGEFETKTCVYQAGPRPTSYATPALDETILLEASWLLLGLKDPETARAVSGLLHEALPIVSEMIARSANRQPA